MGEAAGIIKRGWPCNERVQGDGAGQQRSVLCSTPPNPHPPLSTHLLVQRVALLLELGTALQLFRAAQRVLAGLPVEAGQLHLELNAAAGGQALQGEQSTGLRGRRDEAACSAVSGALRTKLESVASGLTTLPQRGAPGWAGRACRGMMHGRLMRSGAPPTSGASSRPS